MLFPLPSIPSNERRSKRSEDSCKKTSDGPDVRRRNRTRIENDRPCHSFGHSFALVPNPPPFWTHRSRAGRSTGSTTDPPVAVTDPPVAVCIFSADDPLVAESPPAPSSNRSAYHQRTFARIVGPRVGQTTDSSVRHRRVRPQPTAERGRLRTHCTSGAPNPVLRCAENARHLCRKRTDASRPHSCM